jgi:hypothetical protein
MSPQIPITEEQLREMFDQNFERLRLENGHSLAPHVRDAAWEQVRLYWRKLRAVAESVTDTEVKLNLPGQRTQKGRTFCLEGVVDIVRQADKVTMYDLKTHDLDFVRSNVALYRDQLNVYAHIWRNLRDEHLDETAVIATSVPDSVIGAIRSGDSEQIEAALANWDPIVPIELAPENVTSTIAEFAEIVDQIEDQKFQPPSVHALTDRQENQSTFAARVCTNCDLRFSCSSYHEYARRYKDRNWRKFADFYDLDSDEKESIVRFVASTPEDMNVVDAEAEA